MSASRPPAAAEFLAAALVPDAARREEMLGDLMEGYDLIASHQSARTANHWYWSQVTRSIVPLALMVVSGESTVGWLRFVANVSVGLVAIVTLVPLSFTATAWVAALAGGGEYIDGVLAIGRSPSLVHAWWWLTGVFTGLGTGYTLARAGGSSGLVSAIALGLVCIPLSAIVFAVDGGGAPVWREVALSAVILPALMYGAWLRVRTGIAIEGA